MVGAAGCSVSMTAQLDEEVVAFALTEERNSGRDPLCALAPGAVTRFIDDGRLEIDNSAAERALRAVALGRKNYLFAGSDAGGDRAAAFNSLIGTAERHRSGTLSPHGARQGRFPPGQRHRRTDPSEPRHRPPIRHQGRLILASQVST